MLYLTGEILLVVLFATISGLVLGWWSRSLLIDEDGYEEMPTLGQGDEMDPFGARSRLEQCHRDNAALRREIKTLQDKLDDCQKVARLGEGDDADIMHRLHAAESRVQALLDDLQLRDDTIAALENELEQLR